MTNNSKDRLNREFSYPSICEMADGALHISYTYWRQAIKYVRVSAGWITARTPLVMVVSGTRPEKTLAEVIASVKAHPREWNIAISSLGSAGHLAAIEFN